MMTAPVSRSTTLSICAAVALLVACGDSGGDSTAAGSGGGSTTSTTAGSGGSTTSTTAGTGGGSTTVCSCTPISSNVADCQSFEGPAGGSIATYCGSHKTNCEALGSTYADAACPTTNALGECSADPGMFPAEIVFRHVIYSGPPSNYTTAAEAQTGIMCNSPNTWTAY